MAVISKDNSSRFELPMIYRDRVKNLGKKQILLIVLTLLLSLGAFATLIIPKLSYLVERGAQSILNIDPKPAIPVKRILGDALEQGKKKLQREVPRYPQYRDTSVGD